MTTTDENAKKSQGLMPEDDSQLPPPNQVKPNPKATGDSDSQLPPPSQIYAHYSIGTAGIFIIMYIIYHIFYCGC